jgi:hypothetical protein
MPKKANPESQKEQSARFKRDARKLIKSGDLDPDAGSAAVDKLVRRSAKESGGA